MVVFCVGCLGEPSCFSSTWDWFINIFFPPFFFGLITGLIYYGHRRKWRGSNTLSVWLARQLNYLQLLGELCFCNPPCHKDAANVKALPIRYDNLSLNGSWGMTSQTWGHDPSWGQGAIHLGLSIKYEIVSNDAASQERSRKYCRY